MKERTNEREKRNMTLSERNIAGGKSPNVTFAYFSVCRQKGPVFFSSSKQEQKEDAKGEDVRGRDIRS